MWPIFAKKMVNLWVGTRNSHLKVCIGRLKCGNKSINVVFASKAKSNIFLKIFHLMGISEGGPRVKKNFLKTLISISEVIVQPQPKTHL